MYLSRICLAPEAHRERDFWQSLSGPYGLHRALWGLFSDGPQRQRDFLYREESGAIYTVSHRAPLAGSGMWLVEQKEYRPRLEPGMRLSFSLRANPVVSRRDEQGKQKRHDVVMEAKRRLQEEGLPRGEWPALAAIAYQAGFAWLAGRAQGAGFAVAPANLRVDGYRTHSLRKHPRARPVCFSTLDFQGELEVTDRERFEQTLFHGMGPAKGFGCGLMLVKRARTCCQS